MENWTELWEIIFIPVFIFLMKWGQKYVDGIKNDLKKWLEQIQCNIDKLPKKYVSRDECTEKHESLHRELTALLQKLDERLNYLPSNEEVNTLRDRVVKIETKMEYLEAQIGDS